MSAVDLDHVRAALALPGFDARNAQRRMAPQPRPLSRGASPSGVPRRASVLVLLFPAEEGLAFVLTRRSANPHDVHSGQISLPGGAQEAGETVEQTALRETREELGVDGAVQIIGALTSLYIPPSDFEVFPLVGYTPACPIWRPDPLEVADVLECPLAWLLDDERKVIETWEIQGYPLRVPWYDMHGYKVWGATAIILSELENRLKTIMAVR